MATKNRIQILASISAAVLVAASLISACDGGSPTAAEAQLPNIVDLGGRETLTIRPLSEVTVDTPPTITDISTDNAVLRFDSSLPLVCAIVYGKTSEYGMISTDMDMAGGAHIDHHPVMLGLEPETEYH